MSDSIVKIDIKIFLYFEYQKNGTLFRPKLVGVKKNGVLGTVISIFFDSINRGFSVALK